MRAFALLSFALLGLVAAVPYSDTKPAPPGANIQKPTTQSIVKTNETLAPITRTHVNQQVGLSIVCREPSSMHIIKAQHHRYYICR